MSPAEQRNTGLKKRCRRRGRNWPQCRRHMVRTRNAVLPDVEAIHAIMEPYYGDGTLLPRHIPELCENIRDFVVAEDQGEIVGCGALHLYGLHLAEIRSIAVHPTAQGRGAGGLLERAMLKQSAARH